MVLRSLTQRIHIVPEPKTIRFTGKWFEFNGFANMPDFLAKEFGVPKGSWEIVKLGEGKDYVFISIEKNIVRFWGDERLAYATLIQLLMQNRSYLPEVEIEEKMVFSFRGFHLDVARGGIPSVETLKRLIKWLFVLKYNYLALYLEDLFPWRRYPDVGVLRGRYTENELREIVDYGAKLGIEVFPSLELCGHMENILVLPPYRRFSEWHDPREGVINVIDKDAEEFVQNLLEEVVEFFPGRYIHIGGDETWALGRGRSLDVMREFLGPQLYEQHHRKLIEIVRSKGKIPMVWGDMIMAAYLRESEAGYWRKLLDSDIWRDVVIANWDYGVNKKEYFINKIRLLKERGLRQVVAPGLWNWNRYYPDFPTALGNLENFLSAAKDESVEGFLITAWGDDGSECLFSFLNPLLLASMEIAEGLGNWEEKWIALTGEDAKVLQVRKVFGRVATVVDKWRVYWSIWLPKHVLLKTSILKIIELYAKDELRMLEKDLENALAVAREVQLPQDLSFVRKFYELTLKALRKSPTVSEYIELSNEYIRLWLSERKPQGLDTIVSRFWGAAGIIDLINILAINMSA